VSEDVVQAAGFKWKLMAMMHKDKTAGRLLLSLFARSPLGVEDTVHFEVD